MKVGTVCPANDCNHVRAGLTLLGRYKGPGDKGKIKSCLYGRAKTLKCFKTAQKEAENPVIAWIDELAGMHRDGMISPLIVFSEIMKISREQGVSETALPKLLSLVLSRGEVDKALRILRNMLVA